MNELKEILNSDWYLEFQKRHEERYKTVKVGDNIVHLSYLRGVVDNKDITEIEEYLKCSELELSLLDKHGLAQNALEDYMNVICICISTPLISNILIGVLSSSVWDSIKFAVKKVWLNVRNKEYISLKAGSSEKKKITFGLEIKLDENTGFNFRLEGDISEELVDRSLDKALDFLKKQKMKKQKMNKHSYFMMYDADKKKWNKIDVEEELYKETMREKNRCKY